VVVVDGVVIVGLGVVIVGLVVGLGVVVMVVVVVAVVVVVIVVSGSPIIPFIKGPYASDSRLYWSTVLQLHSLSSELPLLTPARYCRPLRVMTAGPPLSPELDKASVGSGGGVLQSILYMSKPFDTAVTTFWPWRNFPSTSSSITS